MRIASVGILFALLCSCSMSCTNLFTKVTGAGMYQFTSEPEGADLMVEREGRWERLGTTPVELPHWEFFNSDGSAHPPLKYRWPDGTEMRLLDVGRYKKGSWPCVVHEAKPDAAPTRPAETSGSAPAGFCTACGTKVDSSARFCSKCGKEVK